MASLSRYDKVKAVGNMLPVWFMTCSVIMSQAAAATRGVGLGSRDCTGTYGWGIPVLDADWRRTVFELADRA